MRWRSPWIVLVIIMLACLSLTPAGWAAAAGSPNASAQQEIAQAFRKLHKPPSLTAGMPYLQGYDAAMRAGLRQSGALLLDQGGGKPVSVTLHTGAATIVEPGEAVVPLTLRVSTRYPPPSFSIHYRAVALEHDGRWQVSWTTMCLLVESSNQLCPPTPPGLHAGTILPSAGTGPPPSGSAASAGLVSPGPLAIAPDGGLLIADQGRNQILQWRNGALSVLAGDGLQGFSGDGAAAVDAELNRPEEMAVAPDGTVYFVDGGNSRVRAIAPDGIITTAAGNGSTGNGTEGGDGDLATQVPLNPDGVAVSPSGTLYISSDSDIREVEPDGVITTLVSGGPPDGVDVTVGGSPVAFFPGSLALDGQGDVIVFSSSPKLLFSVTPQGQVTKLADNYASALSPAPDGSVLIAEHGAGPERVAGGTVAPLEVSGGELTADHSPIVADGIAQGPDGATYVDSEIGDGFNDQTGLFSVVGGVARPVVVRTPLRQTLPQPGSPGFPAAAYPSPLPARGADSALPACPSLQRVVPFTPAARQEARQLLGQWNTGFSYDLSASDPAWWPGDVALVAHGDQGRQTVGLASAAAGTLYAPAIAASCGTTLVKDSLSFLMEPSAYNFSYAHVYLLDRNGTPLVYFVAA